MLAGPRKRSLPRAGPFISPRNGRGQSRRRLGEVFDELEDDVPIISGEHSMWWLLPALLVLAMTASPGSNSSAADRLAAETQAWHDKRIERLKAEDGWLTLVNLFWLEEGETVAGSAADAPLRLPPSAPPRLGTFTRTGQEISFTPDRGVEITAGGKPFTGGPIQNDAAGAPGGFRDRAP